MTFSFDSNTRSAIQADTSYLKATPDGFDLGGRIYPVLTVKPTASTIVTKLFGPGWVHSSDQCDEGPKCPECNDKKARKYLRLSVEMDGRPLQIDLPPIASARLAELVGDGIDGLLRMTCTRAEKNGNAWGDVTFEIVGKEAA
ncbi:MAG: hypothetical protein GC161_15995 [Planctomycetaceae bacterium]|nr:hypothetical protein [Planctomycetaceae bacterium]